MEYPNFRHHQDGIIYIYDGETHFSCTLEDFLTVEPEYHLPEFFLGREYFPGRNHRLYTDKNEIYLSEEALEWAEGDAYIANIADYQSTLGTPDPENFSV